MITHGIWVCVGLFFVFLFFVLLLLFYDYI